MGVDISEKVDIIISEWMGFCLLFESMLDSVIDGRDRLLKEGGLMFPERARIFIAGMDDKEYKDTTDKIWTTNEYGVSMKCIIDEMEKYVYVDKISPQQIVTSPSKVFDVDLRTCKVEDLEFSCDYAIETYSKY